MNNMVIVGAGPVGLSLALRLKQEGWKPVVIEEHSAVGKPVNCTGLISRSGAEELGLKLEECEVNRVRGAKIYAPDNSMLEVRRHDFVAHVIDREAFDRGFYDAAVKAGVDVRLGTRLLDIRNETVFVEHGGRGELIKAQLAIGADGAVSKMRSLMGMHVPADRLMRTYQIVARGSFDREFVSLYFGGSAKNFFGWIVPESHELARIGIGTTSGSAKEVFDSFIAERGIQAETVSQSSSLIPIGEPLKNPATESMLLVGDAAFQTKATTGGGIITGLNAVNVAAELISANIKKRVPLKNYGKMLGTLNRELALHWKIRSYMNSLGDEQMNRLFAKMKKAGIEDFLSKEGDMDRPSKFVGKILTRPRMWGLVPEAMRILR